MKRFLSGMLCALIASTFAADYGNFTPAGDLSGTTASQTVIGINGASVPISAGALASNASGQLTALTTTGTGNAVLASSPAITWTNTSISSGGTYTGGNGTKVATGAILSNGTKFAVAGSGGGCGTIGTTTGGATAGKFVAGAVTSCQVTVTFANSLAMTNDSTCWARDETTPGDSSGLSVTSTTTTVTISGTIVSGDTIKFGCIGF